MDKNLEEVQKNLFTLSRDLLNTAKAMRKKPNDGTTPKLLEDLALNLLGQRTLIVVSNAFQSPIPQTALRAASMGLFPTMNSLQSVVDLANSQLPINTPNAMLCTLMTYHNTLLKVLEDEQETTGSH